MKIKISIVDDNGHSYQGEIQLIKNKITKKSNIITKNPRRKKSTNDKIVELIDDGYFDTNRTLSDIIKEFKTHDYHFKSSALTLPLRRIVRNGYLKKTKDLPNGTKSKYWTYIK